MLLLLYNFHRQVVQGYFGQENSYRDFTNERFCDSFLTSVVILSEKNIAFKQESRQSLSSSCLILCNDYVSRLVNRSLVD